MIRTLTILLLFAAVPVSALALQTVAQGELIEMTAEIVAIDKDARIVTLEDEDGELEDIVCGPEVKRFDDLKVGDEVTFTYYESIVSNIREPGSPAPPMAQAAAVRGTDDRPSGAFAEQVTATVTLTEMNPEIPSVTVETEDGRTMSFKIADKEILEGVKVGDRVDITYTQALMITVK